MYTLYAILLKLFVYYSPVYILTDFGAAKELGEEETFMSIYGTEEYIVNIDFFLLLDITSFICSVLYKKVQLL